MTDRLVRPALRAILDSIQGMEAATAGKTLDDFNRDWLLRHGVQRGIEIVSEAARRIPSDIQTAYPDVPWSQIMGIGNILRHEYHRISDIVVWNVVQRHLPALKAAIQAIDAQIDEPGDGWPGPPAH
ncbi:MAG: DUF86 domain-containing protein [Alphaproteobacteria bacterium]|nr:DUF86 domain-containing protein [Alphaproteobacteria bacterium]